MLGKLIKEYRKRHKITQGQLSKMSGVDRSVISRLERGVEAPDIFIQGKLVAALLKDKKHFHPELAKGYERGEQLGLLIGTLPDDMADSVYRDIINKLKDYVGFQLELDTPDYPEEIHAKKKKRKYCYYKFAPWDADFK